MPDPRGGERLGFKAAPFSGNFAKQRQERDFITTEYVPFPAERRLVSYMLNRKVSSAEPSPSHLTWVCRAGA